MAAGIIDVGINFKVNDAELQTKLEAIITEMRKTSKDASTFLDANFSEHVQYAQNVVKKYQQMQMELASGNSDITERMRSSYEKVYTAATQFLKGYENAVYNANARNKDQLSEEYKTLQQQLNGYKDIEASIRNNIAETNKLSDSLKIVKETNRDIISQYNTETQSLQNQIRIVEQSIDAYRRRREAANLPIDNAVISRFEGKINKLKNDRYALENSFNGEKVRAYNTALVHLYSNGINTVSQGEELLNNRLSESAQQLTRVTNYIDTTTASLSRLDSTGEKFAKKSFNLDSTNKSLVGMVANIRSAENSYNEVADKAEKAKNKIKDTGTASKQVKNESVGIATRFREILSLAGRIAKQFGSKLLSGIRNFGSRVSELVKHFRKARSSSDGLMTSMAGGFKKAITLALRYGLSIRSIYFAFKRLKSAATEALKTMALLLPDVNNQISSVITNVNQLKYSLGAMVQPLLTVVVPVFQKVTNYLTKLMEGVAKFFALITGQGYYYRAKAKAVDYAASQRDAADATEDLDDALEDLGDTADGLDLADALDGADAADATTDAIDGTNDALDSTNSKLEEIKDNILGIDELNVLNQPEDKDGGADKDAKEKAAKAAKEKKEKEKKEKAKKEKGAADATGGLEDPGVEFEKVMLEADDWMSRLWDKILDSWEKADFYDLGNLLQHKLAELFNSLNDWVLGPLDNFAQRFVRSLATFINGYASNYLTPNAFTQLIANFLNVLFDALMTFAQTLDWGNVGKYIVNGINTFLTTFHWEQNVAAIMTFFNGLVETAYNIVSDPNLWTNLGTAFADSIKGVLRIDLDRVGLTLAETVNGIFTFLGTAFENQDDWFQLGYKFSHGIATFLTNLDWTDIRTGLHNFVGSIEELLLGFVQGITWGDIGEFIVQTLITGFTLAWDIGKGALNVISTSLDNLYKEITGTRDTYEEGLEQSIKSHKQYVEDMERAYNKAVKVFGEYSTQALQELDKLKQGRIMLEQEETALALHQLESRMKSAGITQETIDKVLGNAKTAQSDLRDMFMEHAKLTEEVTKLQSESSDAWTKLSDAEEEVSLRRNQLYRTNKDNVNEYREAEKALQEAIEQRDALQKEHNELMKKYDDAVFELSKHTDELATKTGDFKAATQDANDVVVASQGTFDEFIKVAGKVDDTMKLSGDQIRELGEEYDGLSDKITAWNERVTKEEERRAEQNTKFTTGIRTRSIDLGDYLRWLLNRFLGHVEETETKFEEVGDNAIKDLEDTTDSADKTINKFKDNLQVNTNNMVCSLESLDGATKTTMGNMEQTVDDSQFDTKLNDKVVSGTTLCAQTGTKFGANAITWLLGLMGDLEKGASKGEEFAEIGATNQDNFYSGLTDGLVDSTNTTFNDVVSGAEGEFGIHGNDSSVFGEFGSAMENSLYSNFAKVIDLFDGVYSIIDGGLDKTATSVASKIANIIGNAISSIKNAIKEASSALSTISGIGDKASQIVSDAKASYNKVADKLNIPHLAQGAVIPPNREFLAVLGDQNQGTNIEAPLSTIQEAVANVLEPYLAQIAQNTKITADKDFSVAIGDREIAKANVRGSKQLGLSIIS